MHGAVTANESGAVKTEPQGKPLQRCFLEALIKGPLQKRRIDREEGTQAGLGHACHHVGGVRLADAGVPSSFGEPLDRLLHAGAVGHRR